MEQKTDLELVNGVKNKNCSDCLQELIDRHSALCYDVCKKYNRAFVVSGVRIEDVAAEKEFIIYKSAMSYNPNKNAKFSTWLGNQMRYLCLNTMNKNKLIAMGDDYIDSIMNKGADSELPAGSAEEEIDFLKNILSQVSDNRVKQVFEVRYFSNSRKKVPWKKVAKSVGISTQTAINLHNKTIKMLKNKMSSKDSCAMDRI